MNVIYKVASMKERPVKQNSKEWFDGKIADGIESCNRIFKKFKNQNQTLTKTSSFEVNVLKMNNTVEHDADSVLEVFKNYYSTLERNW